MMKIFFLSAAFLASRVTANDKLRRNLRYYEKKDHPYYKYFYGNNKNTPSKNPPTPTPSKEMKFEIKLTPGNEVAPFMGVEFAFGTATVEISSRKACISADIEGFVPGSAHIHGGAIDANGDILVDFTPLLTMGEADFDGCVSISKMLSDKIMERPDLYYVNVHAGAAPPLILRAIRGQFVQGFSAKLENKQLVAPFNIPSPGASGMASVFFEMAGTVACFDVTIDRFDPLLGHIHNEAMGANGPRVFNYSALKVDGVEGRFFGCQDLTSDDIEGSVEVVKMLLMNPSMYYFDYHLSASEPEIFTSIRGQLPSL
eukprot:scaffold6856_cov156-Amphora_coffeaeformis.AAC.2